MALDFDAASSNRVVDHGYESQLDDLSTLTIMALIKPTTNVLGYITQRWHGGGGNAFRTDSNNDLVYVRFRATQALYYQSNASILTLGAYQWVATTLDMGAAAGELCNIYLSSLTGQLAEVGYATVQDGVGALTSDAGDSVRVGNWFSQNGPFRGQISWAAWWDSVLTLSDMRQQKGMLWAPVKPSSCKLFCHYGLGDTGNQPDWSGNGNHGTVTSATLAPHAPIPIFHFQIWMPEIPTGTQYNQSVSGALTPAGVLLSQAQMSKVGSLSPAGSLFKQPARSLAGNLSFSGALSSTKVLLRSIAGAIGPSGSLSKTVQRSLAGAVGPSGVLNAIKATLVFLSGSISPSGSLGRLPQKSLSGDVSPSGSIAFQARKALVGALTSTGAAAKRLYVSLAGSISPSAILGSARVKLVSLAGSLTSSGTLGRLPNKSLVGTLSPTGSVSKGVGRSLSGIVAPVGSVVKRIARSLSGSLSISGLLAWITGKTAENVYAFDLHIKRVHSFDAEICRTETFDASIKQRESF